MGDRLTRYVHFFGKLILREVARLADFVEFLSKCRHKCIPRFARVVDLYYSKNQDFSQYPRILSDNDRYFLLK